MQRSWSRCTQKGGRGECRRARRARCSCLRSSCDSVLVHVCLRAHTVSHTGKWVPLQSPPPHQFASWRATQAGPLPPHAGAARQGTARRRLYFRPQQLRVPLHGLLQRARCTHFATPVQVQDLKGLEHLRCAALGRHAAHAGAHARAHHARDGGLSRGVMSVDGAKHGAECELRGTGSESGTQGTHSSARTKAFTVHDTSVGTRMTGATIRNGTSGFSVLKIRASPTCAARGQHSEW